MILVKADDKGEFYGDVFELHFLLSRLRTIRRELLDITNDYEEAYLEDSRRINLECAYKLIDSVTDDLDKNIRMVFMDVVTGVTDEKLEKEIG